MRLMEVIQNQLGPRPITDDPVEVMDTYEYSKLTWQFIKANCQPWLREAGQLLVYRGTGRYLPVFVKKIRQDREPLSSNFSAHKEYNRIIQANGGKANRSNSAFVTGRRDDTLAYGKPHVVFPIGEFNYTWSRYHEDWFDFFGGSGPTSSEEVAELEDGLRFDRGLKDAIRSGNEIMIAAKEMLYIDANLYAKPGWFS